MVMKNIFIVGYCGMVGCVFCRVFEGDDDVNLIIKVKVELDFIV